MVEIPDSEQQGKAMSTEETGLQGRNGGTAPSTLLFGIGPVGLELLEKSRERAFPENLVRVFVESQDVFHLIQAPCAEGQHYSTVSVAKAELVQLIHQSDVVIIAAHVLFDNFTDFFDEYIKPVHAEDKLVFCYLYHIINVFLNTLISTGPTIPTVRLNKNHSFPSLSGVDIIKHCIASACDGVFIVSDSFPSLKVSLTFQGKFDLLNNVRCLINFYSEPFGIGISHMRSIFTHYKVKRFIIRSVSSASLLCHDVNDIIKNILSIFKVNSSSAAAFVLLNMGSTSEASDLDTTLSQVEEAFCIHHIPLAMIKAAHHTALGESLSLSILLCENKQSGPSLESHSNKQNESLCSFV